METIMLGLWVVEETGIVVTFSYMECVYLYIYIYVNDGVHLIK